MVRNIVAAAGFPSELHQLHSSLVITAQIRQAFIDWSAGHITLVPSKLVIKKVKECLKVKSE